MPRFPQPQAHTIKAPSTATPVPSLTQEAASSEEKVLTILYWQAPTVPGPYLSSGTKDRDAGAVTLEPLAKYDPDGNLLPALASEIPTIANGGFSQDLMSITWKLKDGLKWSDGSGMTADDVVFTSRYCMDEETGCTAHGAFDGISSVEAIDALTVKITFDAPTPYLYNAFVSAGTPIISQAQFAGCVGAAASSCDAQNAAPLGTGPCRISDFKTNEEAVYERNPFYRGNAPYFDRAVLKGGDDAMSAARAVLEMEATGRGTVVSAFSSLIERIVVNQTNPDPALGDNRSEYMDGENPPSVPYLHADSPSHVDGHRPDHHIGATLRLRRGTSLQPCRRPARLRLHGQRWVLVPGHRGGQPVAGRP